MRRIGAGVVVGVAGFGAAVIGLFLPYAVKSMPEALSVSLVGIGVLMIVVPCAIWVWQHRRPAGGRGWATPPSRSPSPLAERGEDLWRRVELERLKVAGAGSSAAAGIVLDTLIHDVRVWAHDLGATEEPPAAASFPPTTADYARLGEFVRRLARP